jgi:uncharacterized protein YjbI with pentapeptide repeats
MVGACLDRACLAGARLVGARLDRASLVDASLDGALLDRARLVGARLNRACLDRTSMVGACLDRACLAGASLNRASLCDVSLDHARINWQSHDLIAELILRDAENDVAKRKVAGLILASRGWCWNQFLAIDDPLREWAIDVLKRYTTDGDDAPKVLRK